MRACYLDHVTKQLSLIQISVIVPWEGLHLVPRHPPTSCVPSTSNNKKVSVYRGIWKKNSVTKYVFLIHELILSDNVFSLMWQKIHKFLHFIEGLKQILIWIDSLHWKYIHHFVIANIFLTCRSHENRWDCNIKSFYNPPPPKAF